MDKDVKTIDMKNIYQMLLKHIKFIIILTLVCGVLAYIISAFFITKEYTSSVMLYVQSNEEISSDTSSSSVSYSDLQTSEKLASTCQTLFTSKKMTSLILEDLAEDYNVTQYSDANVQSWITVTAVEDTSILEVSVTTTDPDLSAAVAQSLDLNAHEVYSSIVESGVVKEVVQAEVPTSHSYPNISRNTLLGLVVGFVLGCAIIIILEMVDNKIKPNDDLLAMYGIPMFAEIVDFDANIKGGYNYEYKN